MNEQKINGATEWTRDPATGQEWERNLVTQVERTRANADAPWQPVRQDFERLVDNFDHAVRLTKFLSDRCGASNPNPNDRRFQSETLKDDDAGRAELRERIQSLHEQANASGGHAQIEALLKWADVHCRPEAK